MAENIPPNPSASAATAANGTSSSGAAAATTSAAPPATASVDQPGRPYYESLRTTLRQTLDKKRRLDEQLAALEEQIFKSEGAYLEETAGSGNIVRGFDAWVKGVSVGGAGAGAGGGGAAGRHAADDRRRGRVRDDDRVFSRSSVSWMRAQEGPDSSSSSHAPTPTSGIPPLLPSGSHASTPGASGPKGGNKKKRPQEKEDDDEKTSKRGKITYARDV